jgi:hypothetical protein
MPTEAADYGLYFRDLTDHWTGKPLSKERREGIHWGYSLTEALQHVSESPDVLLFRKSPQGRVSRSYRWPR